MRLFGQQPAWSEPPTDADKVLPPEDGQLFVQRIPNSYRILICGAAHSLPVSACRQFVARVTDCIERSDRFMVAEPT